MKLLRLKIVVCLLLTFAGAPNIASAEGTQSYFQTFDKDYRETQECVIESIRNLGLVHDRTVRGSAATIVYFSRPANRYSWGEAGTVTIYKGADTRTQIGVTSQKNVRFQITGKSTKYFATEIFDQMIREISVTK